MLWSASSSAWKRTPPMEEDSRLISSALAGAVRWSPEVERYRRVRTRGRLARALAALLARTRYTASAEPIALRAFAAQHERNRAGLTSLGSLARGRQPWAVAESGTSLSPDSTC